MANNKKSDPSRTFCTPDIFEPEVIRKPPIKAVF